MMNFNRRKFAGRLMSAFSALGIGSAILGKSAFGQTSDSEVKKLNYEGKPADGTQMITSLIVHSGLIYISGQGANDAGAVQGADVETHTTKVMNNVKKLVEAGGGSMDTIEPPPASTSFLTLFMTFVVWVSTVALWTPFCNSPFTWPIWPTTMA